MRANPSMPGSCTLPLIYDAVSETPIVSLWMVTWAAALSEPMHPHDRARQTHFFKLASNSPMIFARTIAASRSPLRLLRAALTSAPTSASVRYSRVLKRELGRRGFIGTPRDDAMRAFPSRDSYRNTGHRQPLACHSLSRDAAALAPEASA